MLVVTAAVVTLVACGDGGQPDVDWSRVPQSQRAVIEDAVQTGDCERMQTYFDETEDADVLSYLDWHMQDAGCY